MVNRILVPIDLADQATSENVLTAALDQARHSEARLTVMTVVPDFVGGLDYRYAIRGETGGSIDYDVKEIVNEALERLNAVVTERAPLHDALTSSNGEMRILDPVVQAFVGPMLDARHDRAL